MIYKFFFLIKYEKKKNQILIYIYKKHCPLSVNIYNQLKPFAK